MNCMVMLGFWTIKDMGNTSVDWWFCGLLGVLVDYCSGNPLIGDTYQPTTMGGDTKYEHFSWLRCCQKLQMGSTFDEKLAVLGREFDQFSCLIYNSICWWYCKQLIFLLGVCLHYIASSMIQCTNIQMLRSGISDAWNDEPQVTHSVGWCEPINQLCLMASYGGNPSGHLRRPPTNSRFNRNEHRMNMIFWTPIFRGSLFYQNIL